MPPLVLFFSIIAFLGIQEVRAHLPVDDVPSLSLPDGVFIKKSAPANQLAAVVSAAVKAYPLQADTIVAYVMSNLKNTVVGVLGHHEVKAETIIIAVAKTVPNVYLPRIIYAASEANPGLAPTIALAAATVVPNLALTIARCAAAGAPNQATAIAHAIVSKGIVPNTSTEFKGVVNTSSESIYAAARIGALMGLRSGSILAVIGLGPDITRSINDPPKDQRIPPPPVPPIIGVPPRPNKPNIPPNPIGGETSPP